MLVEEKARELEMEIQFLREKLEEEVKRGRSRRLGVGCRAAAMGLIGAVC
jgi:hypothetical protein